MAATTLSLQTCTSSFEWHSSHQAAVTCWISVHLFCVWWCSDLVKMCMAPKKMQYLHKFSNECDSCFNNYNHNYFKCHTNFSKSWVSVNILSAYLRAHSHIVRHAHDKSCQLPLQKSNICHWHCCHEHDLPLYQWSLMFYLHFYPQELWTDWLHLLILHLLTKTMSTPTPSHLLQYVTQTKNLHFLHNLLPFSSLAWNKDRFGGHNW